MFIKNIGIKNPYENPFRLLSRVPLFEKVKAKIVPAKNAPNIGSISKNTETPTSTNIKAIELQIPSSSGSLPSNILENNCGFHHATLLIMRNNIITTMK